MGQMEILDLQLSNNPLTQRTPADQMHPQYEQDPVKHTVLHNAWKLGISVCTQNIPK